MNTIKHIYAARRKALFDEVGHPVVFFANLVTDLPCGKEDSSFFYFTGLTAPGSVLLIDESGLSHLYVPRFAEGRSRWESNVLVPSEALAEELGFDSVEYLGTEVVRSAVELFGSEAVWSTVLGLIQDWIKRGVVVGGVSHPLLMRFYLLIPALQKSFVQIESFVTRMRRIKSRHEVAIITRACDVTALAHEAAVYSLQSEGPNELTVRAALEYLFTEHGAQPAFPSIVAAGAHATVLHYLPTNTSIERDELVVVDIGARFDGYCADITRTYPASGKFSSRQRELYDLVVQAQELVAEAAKPGMFLRNPEQPEKSLHHIAESFFEKYGLREYFVHGIGHYLGLDVHDVGSYLEPLVEGDVITIEPGLYLPEEGIGIRVEDDFWVVTGGAVCLSDSLPRSADEIESLCTSIDTSI